MSNPHIHPQVVDDCFTCDPTRVMHVSILSVFSFVALISVVFRIWARRVQRVVLESNDYLCVIGLVCTLAMAVFTMYAAIYWARGSTKGGQPDQSAIVHQYQALLIGQLLWVTSVTLIRASVLSFYIRIFRTRSFRITCYIIHAINVAYFIAVVTASCLICRPFSYNWDPSVNGTCGDQKSLDLFIGIFNLLMDVTTVVLPMPVLWGLQMATSKKLATSGMFSMGIAICVITLVRIKVTSDIINNNAQLQSAIIALLTCLEALLGIVNACLPVLKPIFNKCATVNRFSLWTSRNSSITHDERSRTPPRIIHSSSGRPRNWPKISHPRRITTRSSSLMFHYEPTLRALSPPRLSLSPHRPLSLFRIPRAMWRERGFGSEKGEGVVVGDEDVDVRFPEEPLPPLPDRYRREMDLEADPRSPEDRLPEPPVRRYGRVIEGDMRSHRGFG